MHILYVDESGDDGFPGNNIFSPDNAPSNKFIRTGLIIHDWKWKKTNLLQLVDIASYACFRKFNSSDSTLYDELKERIMKNSQGLIEGTGLKIWPSP